MFSIKEEIRESFDREGNTLLVGIGSYKHDIDRMGRDIVDKIQVNDNVLKLGLNALEIEGAMDYINNFKGRVIIIDTGFILNDCEYEITNSIDFYSNVKGKLYGVCILVNASKLFPFLSENEFLRLMRGKNEYIDRKREINELVDYIVKEVTPYVNLGGVK